MRLWVSGLETILDPWWVCVWGAGLIREWPFVGEAEGPTGYLVGGTQQALTPPFIFLSPALLRPWGWRRNRELAKSPFTLPQPGLQRAIEG